LVLDGLAGEPAPTGAFKAMLRRGLSEVALLQPLPALAIAPRGRAMGLAARPLQKMVPRIAVQAPSRLGPGAVRGQAAASADSRPRSIVIVTPVLVKVMPIKDSTCGTLISVMALIIGKAFRPIKLTRLSIVQAAAQVAHVGADTLAGQGDEVLGRAILAIGHHCAGFVRRVLPVLHEQVT